MSKMKNTLDRIESRLDNVEEKIRELKSFHRNYSKLITESEKSYWKKDEQSFKELCYNYDVLSRSVVFDSLWPHGHQASCLSPSPGACSNSCPLIESVMPSNHLFLCCPLLLLPSIFPSIRVFWLFTSCGQRIGASTSASVPPMNIHDWFPLGLTSWISL